MSATQTVPIPKGKQNPFSDLGKIRAKLREMKVGELWETGSECREIYFAAKQIGVSVKRCKMDGGRGWCYWKIGNKRKT